MDEAVTLYNPAGGEVTTAVRAEVVRLTAMGYSRTKPFNPAEHNVDEVQAHLQTHPEDAPRVLAAEKASKRRTTIVGAEDPAAEAGDTGTTSD